MMKFMTKSLPARKKERIINITLITNRMVVSESDSRERRCYFYDKQNKPAKAARRWPHRTEVNAVMEKSGYGKNTKGELNKQNKSPK